MLSCEEDSSAWSPQSQHTHVEFDEDHALVSKSKLRSHSMHISAPGYVDEESGERSSCGASGDGGVGGVAACEGLASSAIVDASSAVVTAADVRAPNVLRQ